MEQAIWPIGSIPFSFETPSSRHHILARQPGPCCAGLVQWLCGRSLRPEELGGCLALYPPHSLLPAENPAVPLAAFRGVPGERRGQKACHMASQGNFGLSSLATKRGTLFKFSRSRNLPTRGETKVESEVGPAPGLGRRSGDCTKGSSALWGPGVRPATKKTFLVVFAAGTCIPE